MKFFKYLVAIIVFILPALYCFALFAFNDNQPISINLTPSIPFTATPTVFFLVSYVTGLVTGGLIVSFSLFTQKLKTGKANRQLKKIEKEVESLRAATPEQA